MSATGPTTIIYLAKQARGGIERLLDALGWPAEELAFHRAVDRCLELEEKGIDASR